MFLLLTAVEVFIIALVLYKLIMFYTREEELMRYKFNFRYKAYNNEFYDYPIVICTFDDLTAYRMAFASFLDHIKYEEYHLHITFEAPENLTILMRKELP